MRPAIFVGNADDRGPGDRQEPVAGGGRRAGAGAGLPVMVGRATEFERGAPAVRRAVHMERAIVIGDVNGAELLAAAHERRSET
ncbi:hypothetical protein ACIBQ1_27315 [Nonomuraea sp. NPDC050153]|uniref:hypothetical protein n=1 Tax=Nonomuraea sp. NPDC050153 TaxID=3364359 RepID=UPI0037A937CE